jgi:hypothetical protein
MKATTLLALLPLLLAGFAPCSEAQGGSVRQKPLAEKTSVVYGSAERTRLLDQLHGKAKASDLDELGSVARRAALTERRFEGQKRITQRRCRR